MITYQAHPSGTQISPLPYAPTLELGASRYLNGGFDFRTRVSLSHKVNFPNAEGFFNSQLIDMNYQLAFKFNNGVFLKRNAFLGPYVLFGIGGSYVQDHPDAYIPLGGGLRFRLNQRFSIRAETTKKISLNKDYQNLAHAIAFVYNLDTKDLPLENIPEGSTEEEILVMLKDTDLDGVIDMKDECPEIAGSGLNGCPTEAETAIAAVDSSIWKDAITDSEIAIASSKKTVPEAENAEVVEIVKPESTIDKTIVQKEENKLSYPPEENNTFGKENQTSLMALLNDDKKEESTDFDTILAEAEVESENEESLWAEADNDESGLFLDTIEDQEEESTPSPAIPETRVEKQETPLPSKPLVEPNPVIVSTQKTPCGTDITIDSKTAPILFETGSDQIPDEAKKILDGIAETMKSCSYTQLVLKGHADARGAEKENLVLSIMRAYNVKYYLVSNHGISQRRINSRGFGESNPIADNGTTQGRDQNRRVDFQLVF
ncbi:MAG: OmpA family protein [Bacteroidetes bacterium]|nr:OmpA family protein [Bacteroidota bacterium]